jgi:hypothetical protein
MVKGMALEDKRTGTQPLMVCCCLKLTIACIQLSLLHKRFYVVYLSLCLHLRLRLAFPSLIYEGFTSFLILLFHLQVLP